MGHIVAAAGAGAGGKTIYSEEHEVVSKKGKARLKHFANFTCLPLTGILLTLGHVVRRAPDGYAQGTYN